MINKPIYEWVSITFAILTLTYIYLTWRKEKAKAEVLSSIFITGFFFGLVWEFLGTDFIWVYPNYSIYIFDGVPLSIVLSWAWWMILCYFLAGKITQLATLIRGSIKQPGPILRSLSFIISGSIAASIIEPLSVFFNWWRYLEIGERGVLYFPLVNVRFHLMVIAGWGILTLVNLTFSTIVVKELAVGIMNRLKTSYNKSALISSILLGSFSGYFSWEIIANAAATIEGKPVFFFHENIFYRIESVAVLIVAAFLLAQAYKRMRKHKVNVN